MKSIAATAGMLALAFAQGCAEAPSREAAMQLAPSGDLRVAVLTSNPIIGAKDPKTGELTGTTVELGRALAARAGVPARMIEYSAINRLVEDAGRGVWDVAGVPFHPETRAPVDFAPAPPRPHGPLPPPGA